MADAKNPTLAELTKQYEGIFNRANPRPFDNYKQELFGYAVGGLIQDPLQEALRAMIFKNFPNPSEHLLRATPEEERYFGYRYLSGVVREVHGKGIPAKTLRDKIYDLKAKTIESEARRLAFKGKIQREHYAAAVRKVIPEFTIDESDSSPENIFRLLSMIGQAAGNVSSGKKVWLKTGDKQRFYVTIHNGQDTSSITVQNWQTLGEIYLTQAPSNDSRISLSGEAIPEGFLTKLLNSKLDAITMREEKKTRANSVPAEVSGVKLLVPPNYDSAVNDPIKSPPKILLVN